MTEAVVFDLDGVLVDSEPIWDDARRRFVTERGGAWRPDATVAMMGMSSPEWARYLHDVLGVLDPPDVISDGVVALVLEAYARRIPLVPGAAAAVRTLAARWPIGLASSSNRPVIEAFLDGSGLRGCFRAAVSSEEVTRGKPAPDVYRAALGVLQTAPRDTVTVEDSTNGIRSAHAAGTRVVAFPNRVFPPPAGVIALADAVVGTLAELTVALVEQVGRPRPVSGGTGPQR